jgi:hypothetical protein
MRICGCWEACERKGRLVYNHGLGRRARCNRRELTVWEGSTEGERHPRRLQAKCCRVDCRKPMDTFRWTGEGSVQVKETEATGNLSDYDYDLRGRL